MAGGCGRAFKLLLRSRVDLSLSAGANGTRGRGGATRRALLRRFSHCLFSPHRLLGKYFSAPYRGRILLRAAWTVAGLWSPRHARYWHKNTGLSHAAARGLRIPPATQFSMAGNHRECRVSPARAPRRGSVPLNQLLLLPRPAAFSCHPEAKLGRFSALAVSVGHCQLVR